MTLNIDTSVTDGQLGQYYRRTAAIAGRLGKSLNYKDVMNSLQWIHDGEAGVLPTRRPKKILELVGTVSVPMCPKFVASKHFKVDTHQDAEVKICELSAKFGGYFLSKIEERVPAGELMRSNLLEPWPIATVMAELGDPRSYYCTLSDMWEMLRRQPNGESGILLTNYPGNIFYIRDVDHDLWAVRALWLGRRNTGWSIDVFSVGNPNNCDFGVQILTRIPQL